jgi:hypothetical protein
VGSPDSSSSVPVFYVHGLVGVLMSKDKFPERVNVMKIVSYTVADIVTQIRESKENPKAKVTMDEVMDIVCDQAQTDFACQWGHEVAINELIMQDENGEDI